MNLNPNDPRSTERPRTITPKPTQQLPAIPSSGPPKAFEPRYKPHHWLFMVIGWCLVLFCTWVLYLRYQPVSGSLTIALVGLFPALVVPLTVAGIAALISRSPSLRVGTAAVAAAFVFTVNPFDAIIGCQATTSDDQIKLLTANVLVGDGTTPEDFAETVFLHQPDIIVLQEVNWQFYDTLQRHPNMSSFTHRSSDASEYPVGLLVWSRWPIDQVVGEPFGESSKITATVMSPYGAFDVSAIHTTAPSQPRNVQPWLGQFDQLATVDVSTPKVLAGDFNATEDHYPFRTLLGRGWSDVHDNKGCGPDSTWPTRDLPIAIYRLDHVLLTDHFETLGVQLLAPKGSDHKPVLATFRFADSTEN